MDNQSTGNSQSNQKDSLLKDALSMLGNSQDHKHQSHGLTVKETRDLKDHIAAGGDYEMINANVKTDVKIKKCEAHLIHITLENKRFDPESGVRLSKPFPQCFYVDDFEKMNKVSKADTKSLKPAENAFSGYEVVVIHDPRIKAKPAESKATKFPAPTPESFAKLSDADLRAKYKEVFNEDADPADNTQMLIASIFQELNKPV